MNIKLQLPSLMHLRPRITVVGVGGAGSNAVNNMIASGLSGVNFVVANTDSQSLANSSAEHRIQLGAALTEGLGAGARPEIGKAAAEEAIEEIRSQVSRSHMVFVAAGMGGGTGTGAAAVIARIAREAGALTVGVVTKPFQFEGSRRMRAAEIGIAALKPEVDTLIVIPNQNLFRVATERTTFADAFVMADQVLYSGIACVVDLIVKEGLINLDFADVRTIMSGMGTAMMGTGEASGDRRATLAAEEAISNPLLDDISLRGAKGLLVSITGSNNLTLYEVDEAATRVRQEVDGEANIIVGATFDQALGDKVRVSIVASGMERLNEATIAAEQAARQAARQQAFAHAPSIGAEQMAADTQPPFIEPYPAPYATAEAATAPVAAAPPERTFHPAPAAMAELATMQRAGGMPAALRDPEPVRVLPVEGDITRALTDALAHQRPGAQGGAQQSGWVSPGGAVFEDADGAMTAPWPARGNTPGAAGYQAPSYYDQPHGDSAGGQRRMPQVEDFPDIAQREYHAKIAQYGGQGQQQAPPPPRAYAHQEAPAPVKVGFFGRLFGRRRAKKLAATEPPPYPQANKSSVARAEHLPSQGRKNSHAAPHNAADAPSENYELPVFFGSRPK